MKTFDELLKLSQTPEGRQELRVMLAELVGWVYGAGEEPRYGSPFVHAVWLAPGGAAYKTDWNKKSAYGLPNYPEDLNSCHEVEKALTEKKMESYCVHLFTATKGPAWKVITSNPVHRTIALILTLQKKEERTSIAELLAQLPD